MEIQTDAGTQVFEFKTGLDAEANNTAGDQVASSLNDYPDLAVTGITAPSSPQSGQAVPVSWTVKNVGTATTGASWTEQVFLSSDAAVGNDQLLGTFTYSAPLTANQTVTRTESVTMPSFGTGNRWLVVKTDAGNAMFELNETNNTLADDQPLSLPAALTLTLSSPSVGESGGNSVVATVSRNSDTATALVVTLSSSDPSAATVPGSVTIPAGQSSVSFRVTAVNDSRVDGTQNATIGASAAGFAAASQRWR